MTQLTGRVGRVRSGGSGGRSNQREMIERWRRMIRARLWHSQSAVDVGGDGGLRPGESSINNSSYGPWPDEQANWMVRLV
jgi:hypothetical protein